MLYIYYVICNTLYIIMCIFIMSYITCYILKCCITYSVLYILYIQHIITIYSDV